MIDQNSKICVRPTDHVRKVLEILQQDPRICLVTDDHGVVLGTITDGDCRRAFLKSDSLDLTAEKVMNTQFFSVDESFNHEQLMALIRAKNLEQIPVVNSEGALVSLFSTSEVKQSETAKVSSALILAGGEGRRLRPLTNFAPKPLLPVAGRPMIERLLMQLISHGIKHFYISVNYLGHMIEEYFQDGKKWGCEIEYLRETAPLGTAGPLGLLKGKLNEPILLINGDLVTEMNFGAFTSFHLDNQLAMTVAVKKSSFEIPFGVVSVNEEGLLTDIVEKPVHTFDINAGVYLINHELIDRIESHSFCAVTDFMTELLQEGLRVGVFPLHETWSDVGHPDQYAAAQYQEKVS